jgi:hypothetical protein
MQRSVSASQQIFSRGGCNGSVHDPTEGNDRLTAEAGAILFLLLAAEGVTILQIRQLLSVHVFIGMLLVPPVLLKLGSTGWRFLRYYRGAPEYVRKGPPMLPLRLLAPVVVVSTIAVFGTGIALLVQGPQRGIVLGLHKASFVVWLASTAIHVLVYVARVPRLAAADWRPGAAGGGAMGRRLLVAGVVVAGAVVAVATVRYAGPWVHWTGLHGHDG